MRMFCRFLVLLLVFSGIGSSAGFAGDKVWVELYLAENGPPPEDAHLAPDRLHHRLHEVFGFKHYELIKSEPIDMHHEWEHWFVPRKDFFMRLEPLPKVPDQPKLLDYDIYKDGFIVANGKFEPRDGTPLFINGPDFNEGRLIFVLEVR